MIRFAEASLACATFALAVSVAGCAPTHQRLEIHSPIRQTQAARSGDAVRILTWNLGYGGLGKDSDFIADGGSHLRPPSRTVAQSNMNAITAFLRSSDHDIILLQEVAKPSFVNRRVDLFGRIRADASEYWFAYGSDVRLRLPLGLGVDVGQATLTRGAAPMDTNAVVLFGARSYGLFRRTYPALILRREIAGRAYSFINVHFSAFDAQARTRRVQLRQILEIAQREASARRLVVIAGDFNLEMASSTRAFQTPRNKLGWVHPFPVEMLPDGWRLVFDPTTPTVRSLERPYASDVNYTGIMDGFVISPGLCVTHVAAHDLNFQNSDHNPVSLTLTAASGSRCAG